MRMYYLLYSVFMFIFSTWKKNFKMSVNSLGLFHAGYKFITVQIELTSVLIKLKQTGDLVIIITNDCTEGP